MATGDENEDRLVRSMTRARNDVAGWPEWKKQAMRALPEPTAEAREAARRPTGRALAAPDGRATATTSTRA